MHVPGSAASTVHVASLVNSLPRWLLRSHCSLAGFLRSIVQCPADRTDAATSPSRGSSTWPMPLPYPEAFSRGCSVSGLHHKRMVCLHVMVLDWLCLNRPSAAPRELRLGARLTPKQWSAVAVLKRLAWDGNTPDAVDAVSMGRSAAKFESFEADLGAIHRAAFDCLRSTVSSYACSSPKRNRDGSVWRGSVWTNAMASASSLVDLCLQEDQVLVASGEDLKDFFYQFQT